MTEKNEKSFVIMTNENEILEIIFETPAGDEVATTYLTREVALKAISLLCEADVKIMGPLRVVEQAKA